MMLVHRRRRYTGRQNQRRIRGGDKHTFLSNGYLFFILRAADLFNYFVYM